MFLAGAKPSAIIDLVQSRLIILLNCAVSDKVSRKYTCNTEKKERKTTRKMLRSKVRSIEILRMCHVSKAGLNHCGLNRTETRGRKHVISSTEAGLMTFKTINFVLAGNTTAYSNFSLHSGVVFIGKSCHFYHLVNLDSKMMRKSPATQMKMLKMKICVNKQEIQAILNKFVILHFVI